MLVEKWSAGSAENRLCYHQPVPKPPERKFKVGDKIRVNLHHGKIEDQQPPQRPINARAMQFGSY